MDNLATFKQAFHYMSLAVQAGIADAPVERVQAIFDTGILSAVLKAPDPRAVNLNALYRVLAGEVFTLSPSAVAVTPPVPKPSAKVFTVKLGGPETTDEVVARLGFPADAYITGENFPLPSRAETHEVEIEIVDSGHGFSEDEGLAILASHGLWRPTYEVALRFAEQHGGKTTSREKPFIVFLHPSRDPRTLCLRRYPGSRGLRLDCTDRGWRGNCVLAGVRPRKQSSGT